MASIPADAVPQVRELRTSDLAWALAEGWRDFRAKRGDLVVAGVLYPVICIVAAVVTLNDPLFPLFFPLVAGVSIAGPAVAAGFYELARRREAGLDSTWRHFFDPMTGRSRVPLATLTLLLVGLFIGWVVAAYAIYWLIFGAAAPLRMSELGRLFSSAEGAELIVFGNLVGLGFALLTLVLAAFSFPMVVDKPVDAVTAVQTSVAVAKRNPGVVIGWGVRVAALLALGTIPFGIGLAVVLPWLGYATWHLYTRAVGR